jgi:translation initiation factor 2 beta subunit (eIF-2beta)/eIF-5
VTGRWFSPGSSVSSTNKTDRHNITEILLNAALNTIKQTNKINITLNGEITLEEITSAIRNLKTKCHSTWI